MQKSNLKGIAKSYLKEFGNQNPNYDQMSKMECLLTNISILRPLKFNMKLSARESHCLLLIAYGKSTSEIATHLKLKIPTINTHRREILRKLKCKTMANAVYQTMRYNILPFNEITDFESYEVKNMKINNLYRWLIE
jgi:DNA-binding CsgD family transcriptional regulator